MDLKSMKRPVMLCFKVATDKVRILAVVAWQVRASYTVVLSKGKTTCSCTKFRIESTCEHVNACGPCKETIHSMDNFTAHAGIDWIAEEPLARVIYWNSDAKVGYIIDQRVGDLNLFGLATLLTDRAMPDFVADARGLLNPRRLLAEAETSEKKGVNITEDVVIAAGKAVAPVDTSLEEVLEEALADIETAAEFVKPATSIKMDWKKIPRPDPRKFYVSPENWEQLSYAVAHGENVLITGPSGSGKSEVAYLVAKAAGIPCESFNMGAMSEPRTSLIGNTHFDKEKGTWFQMSRFARSVQSVGLILLDELSRADRGAFNLLLPLLDRQGYLALDEAEDAVKIHKHAGACFLATANVGMEYTGTEALDKALKERFDSIIDMDFPPEKNEIDVIVSRTGCSSTSARKLVQMAIVQRNLTKDGEFVEQISTRMLLAAAKRIAAGMTYDRAAMFCIENSFNRDGGSSSDRAKVKQIIQKAGTGK